MFLYIATNFGNQRSWVMHANKEVSSSFSYLMALKLELILIKVWSLNPLIDGLKQSNGADDVYHTRYTPPRLSMSSK